MLELGFGLCMFILVMYLGLKCIGLGFKWINTLFRTLGEIGTMKKK